jgi:hypothetical protein
MTAAATPHARSARSSPGEPLQAENRGSRSTAARGAAAGFAVASSLYVALEGPVSAENRFAARTGRSFPPAMPLRLTAGPAPTRRRRLPLPDGGA